jgi:hypothetical protein
MWLRRLNDRHRAWALAALALYVVVLLATPFLHHDLTCHLKSPAHCVACVANPLASKIETGIDWTAAVLHRAGRVEALQLAAGSLNVTPPSPGRSPPA